jgi:glyoxylase-like metal-dependent hydrolase (beta-lactamase superfamily II)
MTSSLSIDVFNTGYLPVPDAPKWDGATPTTWPASTSTLISGDRDALLVDALLTRNEGERLAAWIAATGKRPRAIFLTHGHFDHFFGAGPVLDSVAGVELIASDQHVIDEARAQTAPEAMKNWTSWFGEQIEPPAVMPTLTDSSDFEVEGHLVQFHTVGGADGATGTVVHVPEARTVCSGDVAYNNIHMWLRNSTPESRQTWLESLDAIAALDPETIITGHRDPDAPDDDAARVLNQSRRYIEDFEAALATSATPAQVIGTMRAKYPRYGNVPTLLAAAYSQYPADGG